ncbi:DUF3150 domain-containing protein [Shewanella algae]|uniref:DUF3150 domain-containing protein n=1 Tax=Shewanella TaxID=22 RepID=UPI000B3499B4|nr:MULTISPECIES: DUF3150 domain-containing protein [Shewanella]AYV11513.1 DUF3150 domain-containing protein [Shewanella algae]MBO2656045.1 DUF3150 domain-containing protein [Shewanella algae]QXN27420.1 DUF3150 domain-containing protein [Shewanella putrefaciens]
MNDSVTSTNAIAQSTQVCERLTQLEEGVCVVNVISLGACGEKVLPKVKVELDGILQDSDSIQGSKIRWFPKAPLNFVSKSKQAISRTLNAYGVRWGDMTIVPLARLDELQAEIDAIKLDWQHSLDDLMNNYDFLVGDWQMQNPDVAAVMRRYTLDKSEFCSRFQIKMLPPVAFKPLIDGADVDTAEELAEDILGNLYTEVAKMARDIYDRSFFVQDDKGRKVPRDKANRRIKDGFSKLISKLNGLSFLDSNISTVVEQTNIVLDSMPKTGWIEGANLSNLARWTLVMADPVTLKSHASNEFTLDVEPEKEVDDFGVLGETRSNDLDEDLTVFESELDTVEAASPTIEAEDDAMTDLNDGFGLGF